MAPTAAPPIAARWAAPPFGFPEGRLLIAGQPAGPLFVDLMVAPLPADPMAEPPTAPREARITTAGRSIAEAPITAARPSSPQALAPVWPRESRSAPRPARRRHPRPTPLRLTT